MSDFDCCTSRGMTPALRDHLLGVANQVVADLLGVEQTAYENVIEFRRENLVGLDAFVFGYLKDAVRHRTYEEIQAIERGLSRALQEIRP